jgi:ribosomal protein S18 acetylase RimI-like enzyme
MQPSCPLAHFLLAGYAAGAVVCGTLEHTMNADSFAAASMLAAVTKGPAADVDPVDEGQHTKSPPAGEVRPLVTERPTRAPSAVVRPMTATDLPVTAVLHRELLPHGLFPLLGDRFVVRWHETFLRSDAAWAAVATRRDSPEVVGFLLGDIDHRRYLDDVLTGHRRDLLRLGLGGLARNPRLAGHFLRTRTLSYARRLLRRTPPTAEVRPGTGPTAVLSAVAVDPAGRGSGAGRSLVEEFGRAADAAGCVKTMLVTRVGAEGAGDFYRRLGWEAGTVHRDRDGHLIQTFCRPGPRAR